jgi:hypothetical protein
MSNGGHSPIDKKCLQLKNGNHHGACLRSYKKGCLISQFHNTVRFNSKLPFPGVSLQFQGGTPLAATASAEVMARGCPS